jgi:hypothetical protein
VKEYKYIWLQPECCADPDEGRHWCQDPEPVECDDGKPWTKYILASEHEALERQLAEAQQQLARNQMCIGTVWAENDGLRSQLAEVRGELQGWQQKATILELDLEIVETERDTLRSSLSAPTKERIVAAIEQYCRDSDLDPSHEIDELAEFIANSLSVPQSPCAHDYGVDEVGDIVRCQTCGIPRALIEPPSPPVQGELREALKIGIKWMRNWLNEDLCDCDGLGHICGKDQRRREVEQMEAALANDSGGWIPVSERLPEHGQKVYYYFGGKVFEGEFENAEYRSFHSKGGFLHYDDVSHWMPRNLPLPPTPKVEESE